MFSQQVLSLAREKEWGKLKEMGLPAITALIHILHENKILYEKIPQKDIRLVVETLGKIGKPFVKEIISEYNSIPNEKSDVLVNVAEALGEIGDKQAVEPLIHSLENNGDYAAINYALAKLGDERAVEPLIQSMIRGSFSSVRALGMMKNQAAVEPLIDALKNMVSNIRIEAAKALGQIGDKRSVDPLIELLNNDREMWACANAAWSLGEIGDPKAISHIQNALVNKNFVYIDDDYNEHFAENPAKTAYKEALEKLSRDS